MFLQQNGLVDPKEVPPPIGLSWVTRLKTEIKKKKKYSPSQKRPAEGMMVCKRNTSTISKPKM